MFPVFPVLQKGIEVVISIGGRRSQAEQQERKE
jgi:hypothetical protein